MPYTKKEDKAAQMRRYRKLHPQSVKMAYWAGFIDGEGTIKLIKRRPDSKRINYSYIPYLAVANTNKEIIEALKAYWKTGTIWHKKPFKPNHKPAFAWYASSAKAIFILRQLLPYLRVKKSQAELLIEFYDKCG